MARKQCQINGCEDKVVGDFYVDHQSIKMFYCKNHKDRVQIAWVEYLKGNKELANKLLAKFHKKKL